ncbi:hypothetical protein [Bradyrhizobium iriomotense]|uniref:Aspartate/glutamate racemase family protein n=1 Tax=Bradyrhizobium iriomotense TaxID=441950 RepID=A0ABQ6BD98_9BRAD|nr:hypothetical protein [Bradyrhizobium iriomotense]GLR91680.1 hypothetical protein GCM10007857_83980 [Bradyrhizobium iriomotense]
MGTNKEPVLGIIQLDSAHAMEGSSAELIERNDLMPFSIGDPSLWRHLPLQSVIAKGADSGANKVPTPEAVSGILDAAARLDAQVQLIIGGCGYMWASRKHLYGRTSTATLTSGLEFLSLALRMTNKPVGIITWDAEPLVSLLEDHPGSERFRFLNVGDLTEWSKSWTCLSAYQKPGGWTKERMAQQFADRLAEAFADRGVLKDVGILVIECMIVPDFRETIRSITSLPVLDLIHFAKAALK